MWMATRYDKRVLVEAISLARRRPGEAQLRFRAANSSMRWLLQRWPIIRNDAGRIAAARGKIRAKMRGEFVHFAGGLHSR